MEYSSYIETKWDDKIVLEQTESFYDRGFYAHAPCRLWKILDI